MNSMMKGTFLTAALLVSLTSLGCSKKTEAVEDAAPVAAPVEEAAAPVAVIEDTGAPAPVAAAAAAPQFVDMPDEGNATGKASNEITPQNYKAEMDKLEGELANPGY